MMGEPVTVQLNEAISVRLKERHDFSFLDKYGRVFCAFDQNDSGNISFGLLSDDNRKLFVKYAGARTVNYDGEPAQAIARFRKAIKAYEDLRHPVLVKLIDHCDTASGGVAALFEWAEGDCLHAHWNFAKYPKYQHPQCPSYRLRHLPPNVRLAALHQIFEFHEYVAQKGYVAIDFYDGCIMYDFATDHLTICDVDFYEKAPFINNMGRMWGSSRFMSPEEFQLGAVVDEVSNVFALGATAFEFFGNNRDRCREQWDGPPALFEVACKAVSPERGARYQCIGEFMEEWDAAVRITQRKQPWCQLPWIVYPPR